MLTKKLIRKRRKRDKSSCSLGYSLLMDYGVANHRSRQRQEKRPNGEVIDIPAHLCYILISG